MAAPNRLQSAKVTVYGYVVRSRSNKDERLIWCTSTDPTDMLKPDSEFVGADTREQAIAELKRRYPTEGCVHEGSGYQERDWLLTYDKPLWQYQYTGSPFEAALVRANQGEFYVDGNDYERIVNDSRYRESPLCCKKTSEADLWRVTVDLKAAERRKTRGTRNAERNKEKFAKEAAESALRERYYASCRAADNVYQATLAAVPLVHLVVNPYQLGRNEYPLRDADGTAVIASAVYNKSRYSNQPHEYDMVFRARAFYLKMGGTLKAWRLMPDVVAFFAATTEETLALLTHRDFGITRHPGGAERAEQLCEMIRAEAKAVKRAVARGQKAAAVVLKTRTQEGARAC